MGTSPSSRLHYLCYTLLILLVPNSQAVIDGDDQASQDYIGYTCELGFRTHHIKIEYANSNNGLPCEVNLVRGDGDSKPLIQAKRHIMACAMKAQSMSHHLSDRGWSCRSSALGG